MSEVEEMFKAQLQQERKKYKILKAALKEEIEQKQVMEIDMHKASDQNAKYLEEIKELKERNLQLYERNNHLEELTAGQSTLVKVAKQMQKSVVEGKTERDHMDEMLSASNLLREEIKQKEFHQMKAEEHWQNFLELERSIKDQRSEHKRKAAELQQQITLLEDKILSVNATLVELRKDCAKKDQEKEQLNRQMAANELELDEIRLDSLRVKSELIEKNSQIEQLMQTLQKKGEEAGSLAERLIDLKNHLLDQSIFEEMWHVRQVSLAILSQSPQQQMQGKQKKMIETQPIAMNISFVRDTSREGEFFLQIMLPGQLEGFKKLIPLLHIKCLEYTDGLTFIVVLIEEVAGELYDELIPGSILKQKKSSYFGKKEKVDPGLEGMKLPMAFESVHTPKIIQCFNKAIQMALDQQYEVNYRKQKASEKQEQLKGVVIY